MACPEFDRTGLCKAVGRCPFPHVDRSSSSGAGEGKKKVAPVKPKRKSLGKTPDCSKKSKVAAGMGVRYYTEQDKEEKLEEGEEDLSGGDEISEAKRKRLLRKIELAKQGWTGVTVTPAAGHDLGHDPGLDESGPYEQMPEEEEVVERPPVCSLGDFISLAGHSSVEEEVVTDFCSTQTRAADEWEEELNKWVEELDRHGDICSTQTRADEEERDLNKWVGDMFDRLRVKHMEDDAIMMRNILKMSGAAPTSPAAIQQGKLRSPGLRVLTGRVGKVLMFQCRDTILVLAFEIQCRNNSPGEGVGFSAFD